MDFAMPVVAPAAGTIANVFGALGLGAQKAQVLDGAISAHGAIEKQFLAGMFQQIDQQPATHIIVQSLADIAVERCQQAPMIKKNPVDLCQQAIPKSFHHR